jgi:hypothetical protein
MALGEPDYGGRIDYPEELAFVGQMQTNSLRRQGADPLIGRRLGAYFQQAGLANVIVGCLGGQWQLSASAYDETEWNILRHDLAGQISEEELDRLAVLDRQAAQKGERILYVPTFYAMGYVV